MAWLDGMMKRFKNPESKPSQDEQPSKSCSLWNCLLGTGSGFVDLRSTNHLTNREKPNVAGFAPKAKPDGGLDTDELKIAFRSQVQNRKEAARSWRIEREGDLRRSR